MLEVTRVANARVPNPACCNVEEYLCHECQAARDKLKGKNMRQFSALLDAIAINDDYDNNDHDMVPPQTCVENAWRRTERPSTMNRSGDSAADDMDMVAPTINWSAESRRQREEARGRNRATRNAVEGYPVHGQSELHRMMDEEAEYERQREVELQTRLGLRHRQDWGYDDLDAEEDRDMTPPRMTY